MREPLDDSIARHRVLGGVDALYIRIILIVILGYIGFIGTSLVVAINQNTKVLSQAMETFKVNDKRAVGK